MTRRPRVEQQTAQGEWLKRRAGQLGLVQADIVRQMKERGNEGWSGRWCRTGSTTTHASAKHIDALAEILNTSPAWLRRLELQPIDDSRLRRDLQKAIDKANSLMRRIEEPD